MPHSIGPTSAALVLVAAALSCATPRGEPASPPDYRQRPEEWLRIWSSGDLDIAARADGWVDVHVGPDPVGASGRHDYFATRDRYTPEEILAWTAMTRAWIARGDSLTLHQLAPMTFEIQAMRGPALAHARRVSVNVAFWRDSASTRRPWAVHTSAFCSHPFLFRRWREPPLRLLAVLDSAARTARGARADPAPIAPDVVRDESEIPCGPLNFLAHQLPVDSPRVRNPDRGLPPTEALIRFVVSPNVGFGNPQHGRIDTTSLETWPTLAGEPRASLVRALAGWRFMAAHLGGVPVAQRMHRVVRFVDPTDSAEADPLHFRVGLTNAECGKPARPARAVIDTTRIYGELEITCPEREVGDVVGGAVTIDSLREALALERDALVAYVIDRQGKPVIPSIHIFGEWSPADRSRIASAVASLAFLPGRFAGRPVARRGHLVIGRGDFGAGSTDLVRAACVVERGLAARIRVLSPAAGARRGTLEGIGSEILAELTRDPRYPPPDGVFQFVSMPDGWEEVPRWVREPTDTVLRDRVNARYWPLDLGLHPRPSHRPYGLEVEFADACR